MIFLEYFVDCIGCQSRGGNRERGERKNWYDCKSRAESLRLITADCQLLPPHREYTVLVYIPHHIRDPQ